MKIVVRSLLVWLMIVPLAILNGVLREEVLNPFLGADISLPISGILLCILILLLTTFVLPRFARSRYFSIGITWGVSAVCFESALGLASGLSLEQILKTYDITTGNLWALIIVFILFAPWLGAQLEKRLSKNTPS